MKHEIHQFQKLNPGLKQVDLIEIFSKQFNVKYRIPDYRYSGKINPESILGHIILSGLTRGPCKLFFYSVTF